MYKYYYIVIVPNEKWIRDLDFREIVLRRNNDSGKRTRQRISAKS